MIRPEPAKPAGGTAKGLGAKAGLTAIALVLGAVYANEGGFVDDPADPGGATNHGVTEAVARAAGFKGNMRDFRRHCDADNAVCADTIYTRDYIEKPGFMPIMMLDYAVTEELVDSAVNFGPPRPSGWFQESLNQLHAGRVTVKVDRKVGNATVASFVALRVRLGNAPACRAVLNLMDQKQAAEYRRLISINPKLKKFERGWMNKRVGNVDRARCDQGVN